MCGFRAQIRGFPCWGGGINTAASGYPSLFIAPIDFQFYNNGALNIGGTTNHLSLLHSPFNIHFRNGLAENDYLGGLTYGLYGGDFLIAVPEPSLLLLVLSAIGLLLRHSPRSHR